MQYTKDGISERDLELDVHGRYKRYAAVKQMFDNAIMLGDTKQLMSKYFEHKVVDNNIDVARQERITGVLLMIGRLIDKPLRDFTEKDIVELWRRIKTQPVKRHKKVKTANGMEYPLFETKNRLSKWTIKTYGIIYKDLLRWLIDEGTLPIEYLKTLKNDILIPKQSELLLPPRREDIISWPEAVDLSLVTENPMVTALCQVVWDSAGRATEVLTLDYDNVKSAYNNKGLYLCIQKSKNKKGERDIFIIDSAPALLEWMEVHPHKKGALFVDASGKRLRYSAARKHIRDLAEKMKFTKRVNLHSFRKSESSERDELDDASSKARHGWTQSSRMLDVYRQPDMKKAEEKMLRRRGMLNGDEEQAAAVDPKYSPRRCEVCNHLNIAGRECCIRCKGKLKLDNKTKEILLLKELDDNWEMLKKDRNIEIKSLLELLADLIVERRKKPIMNMVVGYQNRVQQSNESNPSRNGAHIEGV